eukprot:CAMPEP_0114609074 /NCGR_PEP_ID=MMETSP0168-20121206/2903_1 /TAXON_ID=95228 ORGANISM="Vannella sp., Strain DIVA3 517/6/12" /NCGR_SAMPLE_ID=MMETSP0168 /ASSEMBLY_ACC=CAM_ASM_000044 /LENGTH=69 /DNA_ID=CAMNT_0001819985 /DNA_START=117 /DNA_END=327 /DNA_ORIENTATION=+
MNFFMVFFTTLFSHEETTRLVERGKRMGVGGPDWKKKQMGRPKGAGGSDLGDMPMEEDEVRADARSAAS